MQGAEVHKCKGKVDSYSVNPTALTAGAATVLPLLVPVGSLRKKSGQEASAVLRSRFSSPFCCADECATQR